MTDVQDTTTVTLSTGELMSIDFEHAYDRFQVLCELAPLLRPDPTEAIRHLNRFLYVTDEMPICDGVAIRAAFSEYVSMRRIEEALKSG